MPRYYDDNFGDWDIQDEDAERFYRQVQEESVWKNCGRCRRRVKILPEYGICNSCATDIEQGLDY